MNSIILIIILILWFSQALAYETCKTSGGIDIKWNNPEATYFINETGGPAGNRSAVDAGMQAWSDAASSDFTFISGGTTASTAHGINDGANIVTFGSLSAGTVAENRFWYKTGPPSQEGRLLDSDIQFNTYYSWSTNGSSGTFDVQNVGTHEHGHSLCLVDLYSGADSEKTMYGKVSAAELKKQTLDQDDIEGITYLYPCPNSPAFISGKPFEYSSFQIVYDDAADNDIILSHASVFNEDVVIDMDKYVLVEAGYDCNYSAFVGATVINGNMTITQGTLIVSDGTLEVL